METDGDLDGHFVPEYYFWHLFLAKFICLAPGELESCSVYDDVGATLTRIFQKMFFFHLKKSANFRSKIQLDFRFKIQFRSKIRFSAKNSIFGQKFFYRPKIRFSAKNNRTYAKYNFLHKIIFFNQ
mgnify:CR=1 FL=1